MAVARSERGASGYTTRIRSRDRSLRWKLRGKSKRHIELGIHRIVREEYECCARGRRCARCEPDRHEAEALRRERQAIEAVTQAVVRREERERARICAADADRVQHERLSTGVRDGEIGR